RGIEADRNWPGDVLQDQIGKGDVLDPIAGATAHLDRTTERIVDNTVRNSNVLCLASAKTEHRPARAEGTIRDGHEFVAAKKSAGIILAGDVAVHDVDILIADEMESVVVLVHAVVDPHSFKANIT